MSDMLSPCPPRRETLPSQFMALQAAKRLFVGLLASVFRAPMLFFETTPIGRVTNRFSFDTEMIDTTLGLSVSSKCRPRCRQLDGG
jgi:hypothetical protein